MDKEEKETNQTSNYIIRATNVPPEFFTSRDLAKKYFRKFGKLKLTSFKPKKKIILIEYQNEFGMHNALELAGEYNGALFSIARHREQLENPKKTAKRTAKKSLQIDPEVQAELDAMSGGAYALRQRQEMEAPTPSAPKPAIPKRKINKKNGDSAPLLSLIRQQAHSVEEKYRILDARDKLIRLRTKLKKTATKGTCPDMCPEKERLMRQTQHQISIFELDKNQVFNPRLAVKQYSRSSADQEAPLPHDLRPVEVLQMTMSYLMHRIMPLIDTKDVNVAEWYHFLWDRTRGIRKDITQQELCCPGSVQLVEQCARFHIFCSARLVNEDPSVFDQKINTENLTKCLQTLKYMYNDLQLKNIQCENEPEFRAYIILLNLNDGNFMWEVQKLGKAIQNSAQVKFALAIHSALDKTNYVKFFKLVASTTFLNSCILMRYFTQVRLSALKIMLKCYSGRNPSTIELEYFEQMLKFESEEEVREFVQSYGLEVDEERRGVVLNRKGFVVSEIQSLERARRFVEAKRGERSVGEVVSGRDGERRSEWQESHLVVNSFDDAGWLVLNEEEILEGDYNKEVENFRDTEEKEEEVVEKKEVFQRDVKPVFQVKPVFVPEVKEKVISTPVNSGSIFSTSFPKSVPNSAVFNQNLFAPAKEEAKINFFAKKEPETSIFAPIPPSTNIFAPPIAKSPIFSKPKDETDTSFPALPMQPILKPSPVKIDHKELNKKLEEDEQRKKLEEEKRIRFEKERLEKQRLEQQAKVQRQKEIELENLKKLQKQKEQLLQQQQQKLKEVEIRAGVTQTINHLLDFVEFEIEKDKRLDEIKSKLISRKLKLFCSKWKSQVELKKSKRKLLDFNPYWCTTQSLAEKANELRIFNSDELRHNLLKKTSAVSALRKIDTRKYVINREIVDAIITRSIALNRRIDSEIFLKVRIELIAKDLFVFEKVLDKVLHWNRPHGRLIEKHDNVTICLEKNKLDKRSNDSNGFVFISKAFDKALEKRIVNSLAIRNLPIVVLIMDKAIEANEDFLDQLEFEHVISTYFLIDCHERNLQENLRDSLKFLAENHPKVPNLRVNKLDGFLIQYFSDLWMMKIKNCRLYENLFHNAHNTIQIHNESIEKLKELIFTEEMEEHLKFPQEFWELIKQEVDWPCDYRYFHLFGECFQRGYSRKVSKALNELVLPDFRNENDETMEKSLRNYCEKVFGSSNFEKVRLKLMNILSNNWQIDNFDDFQWIDGIYFIVQELIQLKIDEELFVFYDLDKLESEFLASEWFLLKNSKMRAKLRDELMSKNETERKTVKRMEISEPIYEVDIDKLYMETLQRPKKRKVSPNFDLKETKYLMDDLEQSITVTRKLLDLSNSLLNK